ncbi:flagellar biosynthesis protein FlhF [Evansella clarkii]|uniref:flagellar biosynthesis protein FlhF n=1 Tax=Evansella clarkii TaxID=79879 RepID=UPI000997ADA0|nr:flagellar biosynthesis protein FlhF [Evansella clarkii]
MKVKKYTALNMNEAMRQIRGELGDDAVILNSRQVETGGIFGLFRKKGVEVIAAIDPEIKKKPVKIERKPVPKTKAKPEPESGMANELSEIRQMVERLSKQQQADTDNISYPPELRSVVKTLDGQEVAPHITAVIMKQLLKKWYSGEREELDPETVSSWAADELTALLEGVNTGPFSYGKQLLCVVGPTGAGKTTTLAKIAAYTVLEEKKKAAFITTDTYRIAAVEQLKTYGDILNMPVEVAYSAEDFKQAKNRLKDYDVILVDSAGRNFRNAEYIEQLGGIIDFDEEMETHLVLPLTAKYRDMEKIITEFKTINPDKVIFTKSDETGSLGAAINIQYEYKIGSSYITTGQNVPDDILPASGEFFIKEILRS